jgi:hypothetical protein
LRRYHSELTLMQRRAREWERWTYGDARCAKPKGRFRKRKPLDCGKSQCVCCSGDDKYPKRKPTRQEVMNDISDCER